jgi:hypothetical protein
MRAYACTHLLLLACSNVAQGVTYACMHKCALLMCSVGAADAVHLSLYACIIFTFNAAADHLTYAFMYYIYI